MILLCALLLSGVTVPDTLPDTAWAVVTENLDPMFWVYDYRYVVDLNECIDEILEFLETTRTQFTTSQQLQLLKILKHLQTVKEQSQQYRWTVDPDDAIDATLHLAKDTLRIYP